MKIAALKESVEGERRVAITPEIVVKYVSLGLEVVIESGAGISASFSDSDYEAVGARVVVGAKAVCGEADIIVKINAPDSREIKFLRKGQVLVANMDSYRNKALLMQLADLGVLSVALDLLPRITRAQGMDILSSQNNIAGYRAVIVAAERLAKAFPMMMTAAGTIAPVKLLVMGAGVAGLQAIATGRRLGAVVSASDVRPATKEQVESLGAKFIAVEDDEFMQAQTESGYAKPMSDSYQRKQADLLREVIAKQDVVITTALIPGRDAPRLLDRSMLSMMKFGSVVVDLAAASGGNCEGCVMGEVVDSEGVTIIAGDRCAADVPQTTSSLWAKNAYAFIAQFFVDGGLVMDGEDEIIQHVLATRDGAIASVSLQQLWGSA